MARGSISKRQLAHSVVYDVIVDIGPGPDRAGVWQARRQRSRSYPTKREAHAGLAAWLTDIANGGGVDRSNVTVTEYLRYWLDNVVRPTVGRVSREKYEYVLTRFIMPSLGRTQLHALSASQVQAWASMALASGVSAGDVRYSLGRLSQALRAAVRLDIIPRNVCAQVIPPREERREMTVWDADQARAFLDASEGGRFGPLWLVSLYTGMRRGEILGLRWADVDWSGQRLHVRQTVTALRLGYEVKPPKTAHSRRAVSVEPLVLNELREHRARQNEKRLALGDIWQDHDLVFCGSDGSPLHPAILFHEYARIVALAGVPRIRIHDHRHTHASLGLAAGGDLKTMSQRLGHAKASLTLDVYAHVLPGQHADVSQRIGDVLSKRRENGAF